MKTKALRTALLAAALSGTQPCMAAELPSQNASHQSGAFFGAYLRLPLSADKNQEDSPRAGLKLGMVHLHRSGDAAIGERRNEAGLVDVGILASGRPSLMLAGRQLVDKNGRVSFQNDREEGGSPWLIIGGVVVVALGVGAVLLYDAMRDASD